MFEIISLRAFPLEQESFLFFCGPCRYRGRHVVLDIDVRCHIQRCANAIEIVESSRNRPVPDRFRPVDFPAFPVGIVPVPAEVPLADAGCRVPVFREQCSQGSPFRSNERVGVSSQCSLFEFCAECIPACEDPVSGRGAYGRGGMGLCKYDAAAAQPVDIRSMDLRIWIESRYIAVAEIIGQQQYDIGFLDRLCRKCRSGQDSSGRKQYFSVHPVHCVLSFK